MAEKPKSLPRAAALVGPYQSGKTSLLESLLAATGAIPRKGSKREGNTVGDSGAEARARQMSTELNVAAAEYLGEAWSFIDCPGSVELSQDAWNALNVVDAAIVVCEPSPDKALAVAPLFKFLADRKIPHLLFINKMDVLETPLKGVLEALQAVSARPLVLREIPIRNGERVSGHVDLASERAFRWNPNKPSELIQLPETEKEGETRARTGMLETLADFDDKLLEALLEDSVPSPRDIYVHLTRALQGGQIVPTFFGSALQDNGIRRLLKALRHEVPGPETTAKRLGVSTAGAEPLAQVFKTVHAAHTGKLTFVRIWRGDVADGTMLAGERVGGVFRVQGAKQEKLAKAGLGHIVALGRLEKTAAGHELAPQGAAPAKDWPEALKPLYALAIHAEQRADEVKLSSALGRISEDDPSLSFGHNPDTGELVLWGQGEQHLQIVLDRLKHRYNLAVKAQRPQVPYKETIRRSVSQHARHKKQSGGHGQFGDIHVDIKPVPRGSGFAFDDSITGGAVPKQYIPAVEAGVRDYLKRGPLGFPVVDISVTLTDGQYHDVDSSDMAFKQAAQLAMREGMPKCDPILLEPICQVAVSVPNQFTSRIQRLVSGRRGQILGFDARPGWTGWDEVKVMMPQSEMHDLINELRSITQGVGTYGWKFDHLQELVGKQADQVVAQRAQAAAAS